MLRRSTDKRALEFGLRRAALATAGCELISVNTPLTPISIVANIRRVRPPSRQEFPSTCNFSLLPKFGFATKYKCLLLRDERALAAVHQSGDKTKKVPWE